MVLSGNPWDPHQWSLNTGCLLGTSSDTLLNSSYHVLID